MFWTDVAFAASGTAAGAALIGEFYLAGGAVAAKGAGQAAKALDPNKLHHIFGDAAHKLGPLVQATGSEAAAYSTVQGVAQAAVQSQGLTGIYEITVTVSGQNVVVRGTVIEGVARIGTFFIP